MIFHKETEKAFEGYEKKLLDSVDVFEAPTLDKDLMSFKTMLDDIRSRIALGAGMDKDLVDAMPPLIESTPVGKDSWIYSTLMDPVLIGKSKYNLKKQMKDFQNEAMFKQVHLGEFSPYETYNPYEGTTYSGVDDISYHGKEVGPLELDDQYMATLAGVMTSGYVQGGYVQGGYVQGGKTLAMIDTIWKAAWKGFLKGMDVYRVHITDQESGLVVRRITELADMVGWPRPLVEQSPRGPKSYSHILLIRMTGPTSPIEMFGPSPFPRISP